MIKKQKEARHIQFVQKTMRMGKTVVFRGQQRVFRTILCTIKSKATPATSKGHCPKTSSCSPLPRQNICMQTILQCTISCQVPPTVETSPLAHPHLHFQFPQAPQQHQHVHHLGKCFTTQYQCQCPWEIITQALHHLIVVHPQATDFEVM